MFLNINQFYHPYKENITSGLYTLYNFSESQMRKWLLKQHITWIFSEGSQENPVTGNKE